MGDKLMVVAHPDDETIFGGSHLLREKNWTVICITNGDNRRRAREFAQLMTLVGADYEMWNYRDTYSYHFNSVALKRDLCRLIQERPFEKVVSHGLCGEYGHPQHKAIARIMRNIVPHNLYAFSIGKIQLPQNMINKKKKLLVVYRSQKRTIQELSATIPYIIISIENTLLWSSSNQLEDEKILIIPSIPPLFAP